MHNIWIGIIVGIVLGLVFVVFNVESEILQTIIGIPFTALTVFLSTKVAINGIYKKRTLDIGILDKVVKRLWIIYASIFVVYTVVRVIFIPISFENEVEKIKDYYSLFGETFQVAVDEAIVKAREELSVVYATVIGTGVSNMLIYMIFAKYAAYDLEKKYSMANL